MNITEFRQKYPQYNNVDDQALGQKLYNKYYKGKTDYNTFATKFGVKTTRELAQEQRGDLTKGAAALVSGGIEGVRKAGEGAAQLGMRGVEKIGGLLGNKLPFLPGVGLAAKATSAVADKVGLPEIRENFTQNTAARQKAAHEEIREKYNSPIAQGIGEFIGESIPYALIPGGGAARGVKAAADVAKAAKRARRLARASKKASRLARTGKAVGTAARTAGEGGLIGSAQFVTDEDERLRNAFLGGGLGLGVRAVAAPIAKGGAKAYNAIKGRFKDNLTQDVLEQGAKHDVPVFAPDLAGPGTQKAAVQVENVPLIGMTAPRLAQSRAAKGAAEKVVGGLEKKVMATEFGGKNGLQRLQKVAQGNTKRSAQAQSLLDDIQNAGDDWNRIVQTSGNVRSFRVKAVADKKYDKVNKLANQYGAVDKQQTIKALDQALADVEQSVLPNQAMTKQLTEIRENLASRDLNFDQMRKFRSDVGDMVSDFYSGSNAVVGKKGVGALQGVKKAIERDMDKFATSHGSKLKTAWKEADSFYRKNLIPYKDKQLAGALKTDKPDEIFAKFVKRGDRQDRARNFYNALDQKGKAAVRYGLVKQAYEKGLKTVNNKIEFSPAKYAQELESMSGASGAFFKGQAKKELDGFTKLMRSIQRSGQVAENPATGNRAAQLMTGAGGGIAVLGSFFSPVVAAGTAVGAGAVGSMRVLWTTKAGRNLLLASSRLPPDSPRWVKIIQKANELLRKGVVASSTGDSVTE